MSEDPVKKCPKCGKLKARRQITGGNFILKGGGWYADLYHKPSGGSAKSSESSSSSTSTPSSSDSEPSKKD
jgi:predicted nucleic acid-binding Zn ribbon protein